MKGYEYFSVQNKVVRTVFAVVFCLAAFGYETNNYLKNKPQNYFETLELKNSWPTPITVKNQHKKIIKRLAEEYGVPYEDPKNKTKKDSKKKEEKKELTKNEKQFEKEKSKMSQIYDCLMFT